MNDNPVLRGFLEASQAIGGDGAISGGGSSSSMRVNPSVLVNGNPLFSEMNPEDFYLTDNVETFNDIVEDDFSPPDLNSDNRPQISQTADRMSKHLRNSEIAYMNNLFHKKKKKNKETIMDLRLGEIMENTSNFFNNFIRDYRHKIYDTEVIMKKENNDNDFFQGMQIYIIAFVRYVNENDNIIYLGIIFIFISIIFYFFNITTNITIIKNE